MKELVKPSNTRDGSNDCPVSPKLAISKAEWTHNVFGIGRVVFGKRLHDTFSPETTLFLEVFLYFRSTSRDSQEKSKLSVNGAAVKLQNLIGMRILLIEADLIWRVCSKAF